MPDIRYVCLSDLHLGEEDSLLTNLKTASTSTDPTEPSPVMSQLVECLKYLISENEGNQKPTLILNGDILELALASTNQAAMTFERFIELIMPPDDELFEEIIYIPGNHDHHLWETARETQYVNYIAKRKPKDFLDIPWHTTNMFVEEKLRRVPSHFLTGLVRRFPHLKDFSVTVAYPNFGLIKDDGQKCVVFHHGHFIESLYHLMSKLNTLLLPEHEMPKKIYDIEAENFAWIDFFWSTLGRSGDVGKTIESVYERMQIEEHFKKLLSTFADNLADKYDLPGWGDWMEAKILSELLNYLADKITSRERTYTARPLSKDAEKGLWAYMNGPLRRQILTECNQNMPSSDVSFVFGHTHKPFAEDLNFKEYPRWVNVYNTGGWVVESVEPQPIRGAAVVLVSENLNLTSLRMYNETGSIEEYSVKVSEATHASDAVNPFHRRIEDMVKKEKEPWKSFSTVVARSVYVRAQNLRARINERD